LTILGRLQAKLDRAHAADKTDRQQVARIEVLAKSGNGVHLVGVVRGPDLLAGARVARTHQVHDYDIALQRGPFALDAKQLRPQIEDEVVTRVLDA
jgi:hypothetical protein